MDMDIYSMVWIFSETTHSRTMGGGVESINMKLVNSISQRPLIGSHELALVLTKILIALQQNANMNANITA